MRGRVQGIFQLDGFFFQLGLGRLELMDLVF
jgi:hypothetical protein